MTAPRSRDDISGREQEILAAAALLFSQKGYSATTVRDIGQQVGLLGGSLYHYIRSKEALFVRLHERALQEAEDRIRSALDGVTDPWGRLATACHSLLEIQLDPQSLTMPLMNDFRAVPPDVREQLIVKRDAFEQLFRQLIADLPLDAGIDRTIYR
ncbi:MAG: TetR/AcrR family transcriptional regulator, partial [Sphingobium sp.]